MQKAEYLDDGANIHLQNKKNISSENKNLTKYNSKINTITNIWQIKPMSIKQTY